MIKKRYKHLFFDLDNTLWDFEKNSKSALEEAFAHYQMENRGIGFDRFFSTYSTHNNKLWDGYRKGEVSKKELTRLRFSMTFDSLRIDGIDPEAMNTHYLDLMPGYTALIDGAVNLLESFRTRGFIMNILTNGFKEVQYKKLEATGIKKYFQKIFISEEIKAHKPSRDIFTFALQSANARKDSSLMIGDDLLVDVDGALRFGMDAIWFNPHRAAAPSSEFTTEKKGNLIHCAYTLTEIKNLI